MKKAIVTGASGFIGSWLVQELLDNNIETTVIVRDKSKLLSEFLKSKNIIIIEGFIESLSVACFSEKKYDVFYHLAWGGVSPEKKNDIDTQIENIKMSMIALELANKLNCKKFIMAGTVAEYVMNDNVMDVYGRQTPNDMYGAAKVSAHYFLEVRARQLGLPFIWMIIPSTYGERRLDNNIITYTIRTLIKGEKPTYGNLNQMWDFLYISDVVRAIRLIGEYGIEGKTYGIGSGQYRPLLSYIEEIRDIINPSLELGIGDDLDMSKVTTSSCVNNYELIKDTGFVPMVSFKKGIQNVIENMFGGGNT